MTDLADFSRIAEEGHNFCVLTTTRIDGTIQASLVSAGVMARPTTESDSVVCVARGGTRKLANLRARPAATIVAQHEGAWVAIEGLAELIGPDDPHPDVPGDMVPALLRDAFRAAGGSHDDWDTYDEVMREQRRTVIVIAPTRVYSN